MCVCVFSLAVRLLRHNVQLIAGVLCAAGSHNAAADQQHDVSAQPAIMLSPLYAAKHDADGSPSSSAQSVDSTNPQQVGVAFQDGFSASKAACASFEAHPDASATASPSPMYPDTKLYQFADIELAHGH